MIAEENLIFFSGPTRTQHSQNSNRFTVSQAMPSADSQLKNTVKTSEKPRFSGSSSDKNEFGLVDHNQKSELAIFSRINRYLERLGGESQGIARVPEDERHDDSFWDTATMWVGANIVIAAYSIGFLGSTLFGLTLRDSIATIICFDVLGTLPVAALSTFGPPTGMRQMVVSRYWLGSVGARFCASLNAITCIGWSSVNTVAAVNTLHQVNYENYPIPPWAGITLICLVSWLIALLGYEAIHLYERYGYIPNVIVFFVICICLGQDGLMSWETLNSGPVEAAGVLSFGATCYGFAAGWGPYSSDYTCYKPKNTNQFKVFFYIAFWASLSCIFPMLIGAFSAERINRSPAYAEMYDQYSTGGVLWMILVKNKLNGFGQFCMVVLSLSTIANNVPNIYTFSVSAQVMLPYFDKIPQCFWATIITIASIGISIPAFSSFSEYLQDFMNIIAYWISIYYGIVLAEHLIFRRSYDNYNIDAYNSFVRLPFGISAIFAGLCGVAGTVVGMSQSWYTGPIGAMVGKGGDIGFELSFGFAFIGFVLTRWLERWIYPDESYVWGTENAWWRFGSKKVKHLVTPPWARKVDMRLWWAQKTGPAEPGHGGPADGVYKHNVNDLHGKWTQCRDVEDIVSNK